MQLGVGNVQSGFVNDIPIKEKYIDINNAWSEFLDPCSSHVVFYIEDLFEHLLCIQS